MQFIHHLITPENVNLFHTFFAGPLLAYTGYQLSTGKSLDSLHKFALLAVGLLASAYHSWKSYHKWLLGADWKSDTGFQINLAHALFIGPLVAWVGYKLQSGRRATGLEKNMLLFLGFAAMAYHGYSWYKKWQMRAE